MVAYGFSEQEANDLVAFFTWVGNADLNGFPAKPKYKTSHNNYTTQYEVQITKSSILVLCAMHASILAAIGIWFHHGLCTHGLR